MAASKQILAVRSIIIAVIIVSLLLLVRSCFNSSPYSNCVVVDNKADFIGEWLKYSKARVHTKMLTTECEKLDRDLDGGDGPKKGKVRWATCLSGPDCDEAGLY